jgi:hypothetical protein
MGMVHFVAHEALVQSLKTQDWIDDGETIGDALVRLTRGYGLGNMVVSSNAPGDLECVQTVVASPFYLVYCHTNEITGDQDNPPEVEIRFFHRKRSSTQA